MKRTSHSVMNLSMNTAGVSQKKIITISLLLIAWSAAWRIAYHYQSKDNILMEVFSLDDLWYDTRAGEILTGDWPLDESYERGPLYPYFLAGIYTIWGHSPNVVRIIQHGLGTLQTLLIFLIALKLLPFRWAVFTGLAAGCHGTFVMLEGEILIESLALFLVTSSLAAIYLPAKPNYGMLFLSGAFAGLACVGRPNILLVPPLIILWI
ncbi:glycosyltransferase family 39 protein, partial [bacterium]|nr:glycosyltransferase family 39 protein [candidate division CSSED10-310 bacterium]